MRKMWKTLLRILDGSPGAYGPRQRGQSLLELAFITPLLFILILGTIEVGWFANHVLILLEVTRVGARTGTVLTGDLSPLSWDNNATIHPIIYTLENNYSFTIQGNVLNYTGMVGVPTYAGSKTPTGTKTVCDSSGACTDVPAYRWDTALRYRGDFATLSDQDRGFYNYLTDAMLDSMAPLTLSALNNGTVDEIFYKSPTRFRSSETVKYLPPDDIVISAFSFQAVNNAVPCLPGSPGCTVYDATTYSRTFDFEGPTVSKGLYPPGYQVIVVGRYPTNANECNVAVTPSTPIDEPYIATVLYPIAELMDNIDGVITDRRVTSPVPATFRLLDRRDPFDYIPDQTLTLSFLTGRPIEIPNGFDNNPEIQRGYVLTGQHFVRQPDTDLTLNANEELFCVGSEFSDAEVVEFMNLPGFLSKTADDAERQTQAALLPSEGMVLVEMFWHHTTLLDFPFLTTMLQMFGDTQRIELSAWAAFPLPAVEPNITYQLLPED